jgi:hypothetical protein
VFQIRIRIESTFDGLLDPDPEDGKQPKKRRIIKSRVVDPD